MPARICVLDGFTLNPGDQSWAALSALGEVTVYDRTPAEQIRARADGCEIVLTNKTVLDRSVLEALPALRFIAVLATGVNVVDIDAARTRAIPVSNVQEYGTATVAQHVFALLLALTQDLRSLSDAVDAGEWQRSPDFSFWRRSPVELAGQTLGIVGYGRIGAKVGEIGRAFGMNVVAAESGRPHGDDIPRLPLSEVFRCSDVVSLHCPLTAANQKFVNRELLGSMKPGAFLVNTARGGLIDEEALADALRSGRLAGAGLDVVSAEPMQPGNPLQGLANCLITPHVAWAALAARQRLMAETVENVRAFLAGTPRNVVN